MFFFDESNWKLKGVSSIGLTAGGVVVGGANMYSLDLTEPNGRPVQITYAGGTMGVGLGLNVTGNLSENGAKLAGTLLSFLLPILRSGVNYTARNLGLSMIYYRGDELTLQDFHRNISVTSLGGQAGFDLNANLICFHDPVSLLSDVQAVKGFCAFSNVGMGLLGASLTRTEALVLQGVKIG